MRDLLALGKVLDKAELQSINGGSGGSCTCYYSNPQEFADCEESTRHLECEIVYCDPTQECEPWP